jgi:uncharacterized integral membrane protein
MALILETQDARGTPIRIRLDRSPVTIGRALSNDVVLDDPYVDAHHARIVIDDAGAVSIEGAGSVNGMMSRGIRVADRMLLESGAEFQIGRTTVKIRDTEEPVAPAIALTHSRSALASEGFRRWLLIASVYLLAGLTTWLGNSERSSTGDIVAVVFAVAMFTTPWAFGWSLATRGASRQFRFVQHLAVTSTAVLVMMLGNTVSEWLSFLAADEWPVSVYGFLIMFVLGWLIAAHLGVPGVLSRQKRLRIGAITTGVVFVISMGAALLVPETFSDVAKFPAYLKPMPAQLVPAASVKDFVADFNDVKKEADEALAK